MHVMLCAAISCYGLMLAASPAKAVQYCGSLPKNSSAYFSCEALNQQEKFEQDRKREAREQEEKRKFQRESDQIRRDILELRRQIEKRKAEERSRYEQERTERTERTQSREKQEKMQMVEELQPIIDGLETAKEALEVGKKGKNRNVPKISDYGTDMASLRKYYSDLNETDVGACDEMWKKNDADAAFCLAQLETGVIKIAWLREASKLGHPIAQNDLAMHIHDSKPSGNSSEIKRLVRASANSGIPHAQVTVGWWHMTGEHGFKIDHAEAMKWNLKAYKQGHPEGANNIGELYEKGQGVPKDLEQAKSWYQKASVLGNNEATARLEKIGR